MDSLKSSLTRYLKLYIRYIIITVTFLFVANTFWKHWQEVISIKIDSHGWLSLVFALFVTVISFIWAGWIWVWILEECQQSPHVIWAIRLFLKTNLAKYLPGNIWHFYGRIKGAIDGGIPANISTLSVLLEPLLMVADGLLLALLGNPVKNQPLQILGLIFILGIIHPRILNTLIQLSGHKKLENLLKILRQTSPNLSSHGEKEPEKSLTEIARIKRYPFFPLLGEMGFIMLRGSGFLLTLYSLTFVSWSKVPLILSAFSFAYVLGLVIPGAPGGLGVFEATIITLLSGEISPGILVSSAALYRLISILSEIIGAGLGEIPILVSGKRSVNSKKK